MWAGWLLLSALLLVLSVVLWPAKPGTVWRMDCQGCSWGGDVTGPDHLLIGAVRMLAAGHVERTGHRVQATTDQRR